MSDLQTYKKEIRGLKKECKDSFTVAESYLRSSVVPFTDVSNLFEAILKRLDASEKQLQKLLESTDDLK